MSAPDDLIHSSSGFFGASSGGDATRKPKVEALRSVHPGRQHVIGVAGPGHGAAADRAALFLERHDIGHDLARMRAPRQPVDHRHRGMAGKFRHVVGVERADHDGVDIARQDARGVAERLAAAELHFLGGEEKNIAAELPHGDLERHPRARRGLLENHRQRLAGERAIGRARFDFMTRASSIIRRRSAAGTSMRSRK